MYRKKDVLVLVAIVLIAACAGLTDYVLTLPPHPTPIPMPLTPTPLPTFLPSTPTSPPPPTLLPPTPTSLPTLQTLGRTASRALVAIEVPLGQGLVSQGSGSIVDGRRGLILTNWHVVVDEEVAPFDPEMRVLVAVVLDLDQPPQLVYSARVLAEFSDPANDLALLQIAGLADGTPLPGTPLLPEISLADGDPVGRGDPVLLLGFPNYADGTVSFTEGVVAVSTDEWIKTSGQASPGHSGGMLLNRQGQLVGVLTQVVPALAGGDLCASRPLDLVRPLLDRALAVDGVSPLTGQEAAREPRIVFGLYPLPIRRGPASDSAVVTLLPPGTPVRVLEEKKGEGSNLWSRLRVVDGDDEGWTDSAYLVSVDTATTPILFTSDRAGSADLYTILPDGTGLRQLTSDPGDEIDAGWAPDRSGIVFASDRKGTFDLYVMDLQGGEWIPVTSGDADDVQPVWSPDGTRLAFVSDRDGEAEIFVYDLKMGGTQQITFNSGPDTSPAWSPDGSYLVFASRRSGNTNLFVVDLLTGQQVQLTGYTNADARPRWSRAIDRIAYSSEWIEGRGALRYEIAVLNLDDPSQPLRLTVSSSRQPRNRAPDWSPLGDWLVYESEIDGTTDLYLIPAQGGQPIDLTNTPASNETDPAWSS